MALFDAQFATRLRFLDRVARQLGGGLLAQARARLAAGGTEPTALRDYAPGDDWRQVDWPLCARHDELRTRLCPGQADRHVFLLVDCSPSMGLGRPPRFDVARQVAAAIGYVALADARRLTAAAFSSRLTAEMEPLRGKHRLARLLGFLDSLSVDRAPTDSAQAARDFLGRRRARGLAVVISDFFDPAGFLSALDVLRLRGFEPRVVELVDPDDAAGRVLGDSQIDDVESGASWRVTVTERRRRQYRRLLAGLRQSLRSYCVGHGLPWAKVRIDRPIAEILQRTVAGRHDE